MCLGTPCLYAVWNADELLVQDEVATWTAVIPTKASSGPTSPSNQRRYPKATRDPVPLSSGAT